MKNNVMRNMNRKSAMLVPESVPLANINKKTHEFPLFSALLFPSYFFPIFLPFLLVSSSLCKNQNNLQKLNRENLSSPPFLLLKLPFLSQNPQLSRNLFKFICFSSRHSPALSFSLSLSLSLKPKNNAGESFLESPSSHLAT